MSGNSIKKHDRLFLIDRIATISIKLTLRKYSHAWIDIDILYLRNQAKTNIKKYIDERLPEEYEKCLVGLNAITREAWNTAQNTEDKREKIQALSLAKECYSMKLELLTNAIVVDDAIKFVFDKQLVVKKSSEVNDYQNQEEEKTTNKVF
jgi:hypothetical protein